MNYCHSCTGVRRKGRSKIMRLIKCKKCGATIMTNETLLSDMQQEYNELIKKSKRVRGADKQIVAQQLKHINKIMVAVCQCTTEAEIRKNDAYNELILLKKYIKNNDLIGYETLDKIRDEAKKITSKKIREDEKYIENLYGDFENVFCNRTKKDLTAEKALRECENNGNL